MRVGSRTPQGTHDERRSGAVPDAEIEVFPTGSTVARAMFVEFAQPDESAPAVGDLGVEPAEQSTHGRSQYHARPGRRPGATPTVTSARLGGDTDIVRPLLVDPASASRIVLAGSVFELPLPHLELRPNDDDGARYLVWSVVVVGEHDRPVPATLHLLGSPSMVVTVLELVPARHLRWGRARFVRHGVEAIDTLARRIEQAAA